MTVTARRFARWPLGFAAGFVAVPVFHQGIWTLLYEIHFIGAAPFPLHATAPLGVPAIWSLAFWGGVWGLVFVLVEGLFPRRLPGYLTVATLFGAIFPSLAVWFVVFPLKGLPLGGGFHLTGIATALVVNAAWGLGAALFLRAAAGRR